ncbi:MAG: ABC transporter ATP-binding protein [Actinomycetota bacterium]|nr:ABC transporter ATP-binding protein [Actinomycetota bacterium]
MSLAVRGLTKQFGGVVALDDATVDFVPGAINGLIGPNGSGKTTLFNIVTGLIPTDAGEVTFAGRPITGMAPYRIARAGIGRTFQVVRAFDRMTVLENVLVAERRSGLRELIRSAIRGSEVDRAMDWLRQVGLDHLADADAADISYGQKKLLELAAILMTDPSLVMLDEPAGGVNPVMIERISDLIRVANANGRTIVIVEHNMEMVMSLCDHVVVFDRGRPIASGAPDTIQSDERVLEAYLGV